MLLQFSLLYEEKEELSMLSWGDGQWRGRREESRLYCGGRTGMGDAKNRVSTTAGDGRARETRRIASLQRGTDGDGRREESRLSGGGTGTGEARLAERGGGTGGGGAQRIASLQGGTGGDGRREESRLYGGGRGMSEIWMEKIWIFWGKIVNLHFKVRKSVVFLHKSELFW